MAQAVVAVGAIAACTAVLALRGALRRFSVDAPAAPRTDAAEGDALRPSSVDVLVIGGAAAGLSTAAALAAVGATDYLVVEANARPGDVWRGRYDRLCLHDIRDECHLPFAPVPDTFPEFIPRDDFAAYLDGYMASQRLRVALQRRVTRVRRAADGAPGAWDVTVCAAAGAKADAFTVRAKHVVVANGIYNDPVVPTVEGSENFRGPMLHSQQYTNGTAAFPGPAAAAAVKKRRILVVGYGNSGAEIALDLAEHGFHPVVLARSRQSVVPQLAVALLEHAGHRLLPLLYVPLLPLAVPPAALLADLLFLAFAHVRYRRSGLKLCRLGPLATMLRSVSPPTFDKGTMAYLCDGRMTAVTSGLRRFGANTVELQDGTVIDDIDGVVFATGFETMAGHCGVFPADVVGRVGRGAASLTSGSVGFINGSVASEPTMWFVCNRLAIINVMSRCVADAVARALGKHNGRQITPRLLSDILRINVVAVVLLCVAAAFYTIQ
jgi:cation diffusion facilitator CzcD-associated flavoprotein CzcO